jgi:hypothetical protein
MTEVWKEQLTNLVDLWFATQTRRLELQSQVDELAEEEKDLKGQFSKIMKDESVLKFMATDCTVELSEGELVPTVRNWELFYRYILDHNAFEMLQKRVSAPAVREHWDAGEHIPGVDKFPIDKIKVQRISR